MKDHSCINVCNNSTRRYLLHEAHVQRFSFHSQIKSGGRCHTLVRLKKIKNIKGNYNWKNNRVRFLFATFQTEKNAQFNGRLLI